jgi:hypothetical protein
MANMQPKQRSANGSQCDMSISIPTKEELLEDAGESGKLLHKQIFVYTYFLCARHKNVLVWRCY